MSTPTWAGPAAREILGWSPESVTALAGTDAHGSVVRVSHGDSVAVLKRYGVGDFGMARLVSRLPRAPFPAVLGENARRRVIAFADAGTPLLAADRPRADDVVRSAESYVALIDAALAAIPELGTPAPCPPGAVTDMLGFVALSPAARRLTRPSQHLAAIARRARFAVRPPIRVVRAARLADVRLAEVLAAHQPRRRWILVDTNPSNVLRDPAGRLTLVDVALTPGLPDTNFLSLPGAAFRLSEETTLALLAKSRFAVADPEFVRTVNGLFSIFTHYDTCVGLASGSRDGLLHSGLDLARNHAFSLTLARDLFRRGLPATQGYLPFVEWLLDVEVVA